MASEATNGVTGLVLLDSIAVDVLIVCDHLPDMGVEVFVWRALRQNPCQPLRLLVLSDQPPALAEIADGAEDVLVAHFPRSCGPFGHGERERPVIGGAEAIRSRAPVAVG